VALLEKRTTLVGFAKTWVLSFFGNLAGILFFCFPICVYGGVFSSHSAQAHTVTYAVGKAHTPEWHTIFLSAIGCKLIPWDTCFLYQRFQTDLIGM